MRLWRTDPECVREFRVLAAMPWPSKVLAGSDVLSPALFTLIAFQSTGTEFLASGWWWLAALSWLLYAFQISTWIRGYFAHERGVLPDRPGKQPDLGRERALLAFWIVVIGAMSVGMIPTILRDHRHLSIDGTQTLLLFYGIFFQLVSSYTHHRFWNMEIN
jgi:hypothetical protein